MTLQLLLCYLQSNKRKSKKESEDEKLEREIKLDEDNRVIVQKEYLLIISSLFVYKY